MSAAPSQRLTANPVSLSFASCSSHRPRSPLTSRPFAATVALYVFSNSFQEPGRSFPYVIRIIMSVPPRGSLLHRFSLVTRLALLAEGGLAFTGVRALPHAVP